MYRCRIHANFLHYQILRTRITFVYIQLNGSAKESLMKFDSLLIKIRTTISLFWEIAKNTAGIVSISKTSKERHPQDKNHSWEAARTIDRSDGPVEIKQQPPK